MIIKNRCSDDRRWSGLIRIDDAAALLLVCLFIAHQFFDGGC